MLTSWDHLGISSNRFFELPRSQDLSNASNFFLCQVWFWTFLLQVSSMLQGLSKFFVWLFCASTCRAGKAIFLTEWLLCFIVWLEGLGVVIYISIHIDGTKMVLPTYTMFIKKFKKQDQLRKVTVLLAESVGFF